MEKWILYVPMDALGRPVGAYIEDFDFEARRGFGKPTFTTNVDRAKRFPSFLEAMGFWTTQSKTHPVRLSDGKPNRPLTAFTVEPLRVPA